jgi:DNA-binding GntR family transcriptional regulator
MKMNEPYVVGSLTQSAYERLRADVLSCKLRPGQQLKTKELCERLGVSLGAVREALSRMTAEGLVVAEPQRGFRVAPISVEELRDLTRTRIQIETMCLESAMSHGDVAWESELIAAYHQLSHTPERITLEGAVRLNDAWAEAHTRFHQKLIEACDSPWLLRIRLQLYQQTERYRQLSVPFQTVERNTNQEHFELMNAVIARNVPRAAQLLAKHMETTMDIVIRGISAEGQEEAATGSPKRTADSGKREPAPAQ